MSSAPDLISRILRHDRALIVVSVVALALFSWWYIAGGVALAGRPVMGAMREPGLGPLIVMWWLMMIAMMLPSAAPAILLYARVRGIRSQSAGIAQTWVFLAGYLAMWLLFSVAAAVSQRLTTGPTLMLHNRLAGSALLVAAGLYELSPLKSVCIRVCRSPAEFLSRHWRPRWDGAVRLGVTHGGYCIGCCWMLMALLFVGGIMNLLWIVGLTILVAAEKLLPRGDLIGRVTGVMLLLWGTWRLML